MGKVYRHLYEQIYAWENLLLAWRKARKGKRGQAPAATFEFNAATHLLEIQQELLESGRLHSETRCCCSCCSGCSCCAQTSRPGPATQA